MRIALISEHASPLTAVGGADVGGRNIHVAALAAALVGAVGVTLPVPGGMNTRFFDDRDERYRPGPDAGLNQPEDVAATVVFALGQPVGCEIREPVGCPATETSWP
ncbi:hypothetical protein AB0J63_17080 [Streptosporangium canum]|uniref:hypothetical protein n=1 Tax=Streptosporangium canum TaxID=324952 RepID=UPI0034285A47